MTKVNYKRKQGSIWLWVTIFKKYFQRVCSCFHGEENGPWQAGRHDSGAATERFHLICKKDAEKDLASDWAFETLKILSSDRFCPARPHPLIFSTKNWTFKYVNLWCTHSNNHRIFFFISSLHMSKLNSFNKLAKQLFWNLKHGFKEKH